MDDIAVRLVRRGWARSPKDPETRHAWDNVLTGLVGKRLPADGIGPLVERLRSGETFTAAPDKLLEFSSDGKRATVAFFGDPRACPAAELADELEALLSDAGAGLPRHAPTPPPRPGRHLTTRTLRFWAERLCWLTSEEYADAATALGGLRLVGEPERTSRVTDRQELAPIPGSTRIELARRDGRLGMLEVELDGAEVTRSDLDDWLGHGSWTPRVHHDSDHSVAYHLYPPGAPHTCAVFPYFRTEPTWDAVAHRVLLRRESPL